MSDNQDTLPTIRESDLKGDCFRLNSVLNLLYQQIQGTFTLSSAAVVSSSGGGSAQSLVGTHADRLGLPAVNYGVGAFFRETDRTVTYQVQYIGIAKAWVYYEGVCNCLQSALAGLGLGATDIGFRAWVTDFAHLMVWGGAAWSFGDGDQPLKVVGYAVGGPNSLPAPGTGWKILDGTGDDGVALGVAHPIKYLKSNGATGSITSYAQLNIGVVIRAGSAFTASTLAAVAPGLTGAPAGAITTISATSTTAIRVSAAGSSLVADQTHTHPAPVFTGSAGTLAVTATGWPPTHDLVFYVRK